MRTPLQFIHKYFLYGQTREEAATHRPSQFDSFYSRHRKIISLLVPFIFVQILYWTLATEYGFWRLFGTRCEMAIVMAFGSFIGGASAEGGGAIAFPVLTLVFHVDPSVARDYAVMCQSISMNSAALSVQLMGVVVERQTMVFSSVGGAIGSVICIEFLDDQYSNRAQGEAKKMAFVSIFMTFAIALFILNREKKRQTFDQIESLRPSTALVLLLVGLIGGTLVPHQGLISGISGSGLDVFTFSILTLLYRINEKVATPTTVSLAGINSAVIWFWRHHKQHAIDPLAWEYLAVVVPVVVMVAPLGALVSSHCHRQTLAFLIYVLETTALVSSLPSPLNGCRSLPWLSFALASICVFCRSSDRSYYSTPFLVYSAVNRAGIHEGGRDLEADQSVSASAMSWLYLLLLPLLAVAQWSWPGWQPQQWNNRYYTHQYNYHNPYNYGYNSVRGGGGRKRGWDRGGGWIQDMIDRRG